MNDVTEERVQLDDPTVLLVKGSKGDREVDREYVKKLANAVSEVYAKHNIAKLRCVGPAALNNAVKASIIAVNNAAKDTEEKKSEELVMKVDFTPVVFSGVEKTGILIEIVKR